jgi:Skp family chaperone for outer membrane proteins
MKNLGTILSIVALIGVGYLILNQNSVDTKESKPEKTEQPAVKSEGGVSIAFVKSDSLLARYELHQEYKAKLEAKALEIDADLERRSKGFQESIADLEQRAASLSPQQIQQSQLELQQIQQNLLKYRDERTQELAAEEQQLTALIKEDMDSVLAKIQAREGYDFIFSYDPASELLATNPAYDITDIVVKALNEAYQNKKGEGKE